MSDLLLHPEHAREPLQASFSDEANPLGPGRRRVRRVRHVEAAGAGPGAGDDGLPAGGAASLARSAAVPPGRAEHRGQRASVRTARMRRPRTKRLSSARSRCACATRAPPTATCWSAAAGRCPRIPKPMELNIPAIHGVGGSRIYFVDRYREFSIYDVDFVPIPSVDPRAACRGGHPLLRHRPVHRRWRAATTGSSSIPSCSAPRRSRTSSASASCPRASCCARRPWTRANRFMLQLIEPELDCDGRVARAPAAHRPGRSGRAGRRARAARARAWSSWRPRPRTPSGAAPSPRPILAASCSSWCTATAAAQAAA